MSNIQQLVIDSATKYGVPVNIALAQAKAESNFNPLAVSSAGAQGVMQLMPSTARELGVSNVFDPAENIDAGFRYLRQQYDRFGDWALALAAYNAGAGNVVKYGGVPPFTETQIYVEKVLTGNELAASPNTSDDSSNASNWLLVGALALGVWVVVS